MARYRLHYIDAAVQELVDIHDLIAAYAGGIVADRKLAEIEAAVERLADYPKVGSLRDEMSPGLRAIPAAEKAVICFKVDDDTLTVFIVCVSYAGSDWTSRVKERR